MKHFILILIIITINLMPQKVFADSIVLQAGVSMSDRIPQGFFGTWKIQSTIKESSNSKMFNNITTDFWNLSKTGDVITLTNPISGAEASLTIQDVKNNQIKFTHISENKNAKMTETPTLTLNGENFFGTDRIVVEKFVNGKKISEDYVIYDIKAQKISGNSAESFFTSNR